MNVPKEKIDNIARLVRLLPQTDHPGPLVAQASRRCPAEHPPVEGDLADLFEARLTELRAPGDEEPAVIHAQDLEQAARRIAELCRDVPPDEILWQRNGHGTCGTGVSPVSSCGTGVSPVSDHRPEARATSGLGTGAKRDYTVGVTGATALIAATGSIILEPASAEEGYPSLLVERHIVVAGRDQLMPDLTTFYQRLADRCDAGEALPNQVCITGCSRTADIEKLLVAPAHGPRQVRVILCQAPVDWEVVRKAVASIPSPQSEP